MSYAVSLNPPKSKYIYYPQNTDISKTTCKGFIMIIQKM